MYISKGIKNNGVIDLLKFIMSALIVAMHTQLFGGILYPVTRLAVPVFFILSSYLFFSKNTDLSAKEKNTHLIHFIKRNLKLYLFWFVTLLPLTVYIGKYYETVLLSSLLRMFKNFFFASTFQASWYIMALIIGMCFVFFLSYKLSNISLLVIGAVFYCVACLSSNYIFIVFQNETLHGLYTALTNTVDLPCRNFIVGIIYIVLGKVIAETDIDTVSKNKNLLFTALSFVMLIAECVIVEKSGVKVYDNDCFIFLVPTSYFLVKFCMSISVTVPKAEILRKMSTVVYCAHMPVFMVVGKVLSLTGVKDSGNVLVFVLVLLLTWAVALVIFKLEKFKGLKFLKYSH